jgi:hypothetical protein
VGIQAGSRGPGPALIDIIADCIPSSASPECRRVKNVNWLLGTKKKIALKVY